MASGIWAAEGMKLLWTGVRAALGWQAEACPTNAAQRTGNGQTPRPSFARMHKAEPYATYRTRARMGAANKGVEEGWSAPASFSSVTATASRFATVACCICIALPSGADWNMPAAFALPSPTIHISYAFPGGAGGRSPAISRMPCEGLTYTLPLACDCPSPRGVIVVSAPVRIANATITPFGEGQS